MHGIAAASSQPVNMWANMIESSKTDNERDAKGRDGVETGGERRNGSN